MKLAVQTRPRRVRTPCRRVRPQGPPAMQYTRCAKIGPGGVKMAEKQRTEIDAGLLEELRARAHEQSRTERELLE